MQLTWFGHSSLRLVAKDGTTIYVDPYAGEASAYDAPADAVLVTHEHYDHLKAALLPKIVVDATKLYGPRGVARNHHGMVPVWVGEVHKVNDVIVRVVEAYTPNKQYHPKGLGVGYVLTADNMTIYIAGDTDFIKEMREFRADVVVLPIGGIYTMNAKEAAQVVLGMKPKVAIPYHWGSVVGHLDDAEMFKELIDVAGTTKVHILSPGQTVDL